MAKRVVITGGCGFVGHHFVEDFLKNTDWEIDIIDKLTYASMKLDRIRDIEAYDNKRVRIFTADITRPIADGLIEELSGTEVIFHLAAETHVDKSIADPEPFVMSNVVGTMHMLNFARKLPRLTVFHYFSTDEVFGPAVQTVIYWRRGTCLEGHETYYEWDRYNSTNPYSATKAGAEELCLAWANTYRLPVFITHTMNNFGERQHPEKFIPQCVKKILAGETVTIHSDATRTKAGSRFYIHCRNVAAAARYLVPRFVSREKYNVVGEREVSNLEMAQLIADVLGKPLRYEMVDFHSSRPGHDLRYSLSGDKMLLMEWEPPVSFERSLEKTVAWIADPAHRHWLEYR